MVNRMIYCDLLRKTEKSVIYSFYGGRGEKGEIEFPLYSTGEFKILKEPEFHVAKHWIESLYFKKYKSFLKGETPEKIAYEC